jgi:HSP20 family protein
MALLKSEDPARKELEPLASLRHGIDRLFEEFFGTFGASRSGELGAAYAPPIDLKENEKEFILRAELPGLHKEDLEIDITSESVSLQGERKEDTESAEVCYRCRESKYGAFRRKVELPQPIVPESAKARLESGILTLVLPKAQPVPHKQVRIRIE